MGKGSGIFNFTGSVDKFTGYKRAGSDEIFYKKKAGPSKAQMMTSPNFARTRENMSEFGGANAAGKAIRRPLLSTKNTWDITAPNRLTKALKVINLLDTAAVRGQRSFQITQYGGPLEGFEFNNKEHFAGRFKGDYAVTIDAARAGARFVTPVTDAPHAVLTPVGATHFRIGLSVSVLSDYYYNATDQKYMPSGGGASLNGLGGIAYSDYQDSTDSALPVITLHATLPQTGTPPAPPTLTPDVSLLVCVNIEFFQLAGGKYYAFNEGQAMRLEKIVTH